MRVDDTKNDKESEKVAHMNVYRSDGYEQAGQEPDSNADSLAELLDHMRRVREAVPVNHRLREELRARLTAMQAGDSINFLPVPPEPSKPDDSPAVIKSSRGFFLWIFPAVLLIAALCWVWWSMLAPKTLEAGPEKEVSRFWLEEDPLDFVSLPQNRGFIAVRSGALQLLDSFGSHVGVVKPPAGQSYALPVVSPSGEQLTLVRHFKAGGGEIITAKLPVLSMKAGEVQLMEEALAGAEVLVKIDGGKSLTGLAWSPDLNKLAYSVSEPSGGSETFLLEKGKAPVSLGEGGHPTWSPDGDRLVVERDGASGQPELWLTGPCIQPALLTEGERPAWGPRGTLAFIKVKTTERVLTYSPDGSPLFTVRQPQGEIRLLNLGRKGEVPLKKPDGQFLSDDRLLLSQDTRPGTDELNWLKKLETEGVREPRTLLMEPVSNFQNMKFSPDGKTLLVARREGGTVALVQVTLKERLTKRGDRS